LTFINILFVIGQKYLYTQKSGGIAVKNKKIIISLVVVAILVIGALIGWKMMFGVQKVAVDSSEQGQKIEQYANPGAFITPYQLKQLMETNKDVVVIGALNPKNADAQITGSFNLWRDAYSADESEFPYGGMSADVEKMEALLSSFGVTEDTIVVTYASNDHHDAARIWFQMKSLGHEDVRYLDGGLNAWAGAGYPTGGSNPVVEATVYKAPNPNDDLLATIDDVIVALDDESVMILDTRKPEEESGEKTIDGAFGPGKIEGALFIPWTDAVAEDTTLKTLDELKEIYSGLEGKNVIAYCQSGVRSAHSMFVLSQVLGYENIKNYDGSWIEYSYEVYENGNELARIENGDK
jgi:thiosulfate/3-mercaptopyruvate sulfurtransferase